MTAAIFRLPISRAFEQFHGSMDQRCHAKRYGMDLAWISARAECLACSGCGHHRSVPREATLTTIASLHRRFIDDHAGCVLSDAQPRRAS